MVMQAVLLKHSCITHARQIAWHRFLHEAPSKYAVRNEYMYVSYAIRSLYLYATQAVDTKIWMSSVSMNSSMYRMFVVKKKNFGMGCYNIYVSTDTANFKESWYHCKSRKFQTTEFYYIIVYYTKKIK